MGGKGYGKGQALVGAPPRAAPGRPSGEGLRPHSVGPPDGRGGSGGRTPSVAAARRPRPKPAWGDPQGFKLEELEVGAKMEGVVTNVGKYGVFVDVGAECDGMLFDSGRASGGGSRISQGDYVTCTVDQVDLERRRFTARQVDQEASAAWNRVPLESLELGARVRGVVTSVAEAGLFVNIRAERDGLCALPESLRWRFRAGQLVYDLEVAAVDPQQRRLRLRMDNAKALIGDARMATKAALPLSGEPPLVQAGQAHRPLASSVASSRAGARWQRTREEPENAVEAGEEEARRPVVGSTVDGTVIKVLRDGCEMKLEGGLRGEIRLPTELLSELFKGDQIEGMVVQRAPPKGPVILSMEGVSLQLDVPQQGAPPEKSRAKAKAKAGAGIEGGSRLDREGLVLGDSVDGIVLSKDRRGVLVAITEDLQAVLEVAPELKAEFMAGDEVQGMTIERVDARGQVFLAMEAPELCYD